MRQGTTRHVHIHAGSPHYPASDIDGFDHQDEVGQFKRMGVGQEIYQAAHTPRLRLSAVAGERMN